MGFVQYFVVVLISLAQCSPTIQGSYVTDKSGCFRCPPGEYQKSCRECEACPHGRFTSEWNSKNCQPCYGDCSPNYHLKVTQSCTNKTDVRCVCEDGFRCTETDSETGNCRVCERDWSITKPPRVTHAPPPTSPEHSRTSPKPCLFPKCGHSAIPTEGNVRLPIRDSTNSLLVAILCPVALFISVALVILFCVRNPGDETCFRQTIAKLWNKEKQNASHKSKESNHHFPRDSFSAKQQQTSTSAANLGPVHVHNPGTIIFSNLSHFTGQIGPTTEGGSAPAKAGREEEYERDCPVFHPTSSPSVHLSEEERSTEMDSIFFPSQEEGKDYHMSKEEMV
ncbi:uncharacterized protein KZ484_026461 [Pholidichthys leucotaenia]